MTFYYLVEKLKEHPLNNINSFSFKSNGALVEDSEKREEKRFQLLMSSNASDASAFMSNTTSPPDDSLIEDLNLLSIIQDSIV